jgi:hypothetical protein
LENSTTEPGQPCVSTSGSASARGDLTWPNTIGTSSITVRNSGQAFSRASAARQS